MVLLHMINALKYELRQIISGKSQVRHGTIIQSAASYLRNCPTTSQANPNAKHFKKEEAKSLETFISNSGLWLYEIDLSQYVSEGAEQKVYLKDSSLVVKLNDSIYYNSWQDYFHNLLLHNFFFEDTAYRLLGFTKQDGVLYAVVEQAFVTITTNTNLNDVTAFLTSNGFENNRNNDYIHRELGIILEDLHDENVLTRNGVLYFIDTVFYLTRDFWL